VDGVDVAPTAPLSLSLFSLSLLSLYDFVNFLTFTQDKHRCTSYFLLPSLANNLLKLRIISPKIKIPERNFPFRHVRKYNKHQRMIQYTKRKKISFKTRELTLPLHTNKYSIQFLQNRIITLPISLSKHKTSESNILQTRLSETIIKVILPRRP